MKEVHSVETGENFKISKNKEITNAIKNITVNSGRVTWPLLGISYIVEPHLKSVDVPLEYAALASLIVYLGAKINS
jgi:hypothetical protein